MHEASSTWEQLGLLPWLLSYYSCCGPQFSSKFRHYAEEVELDPLLVGGPKDSLQAPVAQSMAGGTNLNHLSDGSAKGPCLVLVMRHAHREDEDDEAWPIMAARPWDPPLSQLGRRQAKEAAQLLAAQQGELQIDFVVTSPYLRYDEDVVLSQVSLGARHAAEIRQGMLLPAPPQVFTN